MHISDSGCSTGTCCFPISFKAYYSKASRLMRRPDAVVLANRAMQNRKITGYAFTTTTPILAALFMPKNSLKKEDAAEYIMNSDYPTNNKPDFNSILKTKFSLLNLFERRGVNPAKKGSGLALFLRKYIGRNLEWKVIQKLICRLAYENDFEDEPVQETNKTGSF